MQIMFLDRGINTLEEKSYVVQSTESKYLSFMKTYNLKIDIWYPCVFLHITTTPQGKLIHMTTRITDNGEYRYIDINIDDVNNGFVKFDFDINNTICFS